MGYKSWKGITVYVFGFVVTYSEDRQPGLIHRGVTNCGENWPGICRFISYFNDKTRPFCPEFVKPNRTINSRSDGKKTVELIALFI